MVIIQFSAVKHKHKLLHAVTSDGICIKVNSCVTHLKLSPNSSIGIR